MTLHVGWTVEPDNLNPFIGQEQSTQEITHLNYDFLTGYSPADVQPRPELATSWSHSPDGKVWTFKLRQGVNWQDGVPFTARDVAFTFNYIVQNQMGNYTNYTTYVEKVVAVDDSTVKFICSKPKANILGLLVPILPEHIWSKVSATAAGKTYRNAPPIVGTGPFQVVEWKRGQYVRMEANKSYWRGRPKVDEIIFEYYTNPENMVSDLKTGALQVAWDIPPASFDPLNQASGIKAIGADINGIYDLGFNCYTGKTSLGNPVLKDWRFRQALNWAVDKQQIATVAYLGHAVPATTLVRSNYYPTSLDYHWQPPANELYTFDLNKAKAALDAAGYTDTNGDGIRDYQGKPITLRLWARTNSVGDQRAGRLVTGWLQQVGLRIKYEVIDEGAMSDKIWNFNSAGQFAPDYDMFIWYWISDPDLNFLLSVLTTDQITNWSDTAWSNAEYDRLYLQQAATIDPQARKEVTWRMEEIAYRESPYILLVYPQWLEAYNDSAWTGWVRSPEGRGGVIYNYNNIDSYLFVHPTANAASGGGTSGVTTWIVLAVIAAAVVVVLFLTLRRRRKVEEV